jgi:hypothetical protein
MSEWNKDGEAQLDGEIARLRNALGEVNAPNDGEQELRAAFRAQRAALSGQASAAARVVQHWDRSPPPARSRAGSRRRAAFAAGTLAASVAVAAIVLVGFDRYATYSDATQAARTTLGAVTRESSAAVGAGETPATAAFQPLLYSPGISPAQAYSVVRVRIPLTSLVGYGAPLDGTIEADVLVGEDGLATGIRFDTADAPLVSMVSY